MKGLIKQLSYVFLILILGTAIILITSCSATVSKKYDIITALTNNNYKEISKILQRMEKGYDEASVSQKCDYHYYKGCYLFSKDLIDEAEAEFDNCLSLNNAYVSALYSRAELNITCKHDLYNAIEDYEQLIKILSYAEENSYFNHNSILTLYLIAGCSPRITEHNKNKKFVSKSMHIDELNKICYGSIIKAYMDIPEYRKAIPVINNYLVLNPDAFGLNSLLADCYFNLSEYENSINAYIEYLKHNESNYYPYYKIGICYFNLNKFEKCIEKLSISLDMLKPIDTEKYKNFVMFENDEQLKETYLRNAQEQSDTIESILFYRARSLGKLKNYSKAISDLSEILDKNPEHENALYYRGYFYNYSGKQKAALADFLKLIKLNPKKYSLTYSIAMIYDSFGDFDQAIKYYDKFISRIENRNSVKYQAAKKRFDDLTN